MNCDSVVKQFSLLLYGELSFEDEETVQQHLDVCAACTTELRKTRALHQQVDAAEYRFPKHCFRTHGDICVLLYRKHQRFGGPHGTWFDSRRGFRREAGSGI